MTAAEPAGRGLDAEAVKAEVKGERFLALADALGARGRKKVGALHWRCACFLHGGNGPNLVLTPIAAGGIAKWNCVSSCGGGDAITLVQRARGLDFKAALEWLGAWAGVSPGAEWVRPEPRGRVWAPDVGPRVDAAEVGAFLGRVWATVADAPWSPEVGRWLAERRGIEPDAAYVLGCRDWTTRRAELAELVHGAGPDVLEAVGFARAGGYMHPAVSACFDGVPAVAVPIWRFGRAYPERWRWRWVQAPDGRPKSDSPFAAGGVPADFLGAGRPGRLEGAEVRLVGLGDGGPGSGLVVLVEGEPDLWAATEALDGRAVVLGVCGSPKRWREGWPSMADFAALGVRRVAVCVHHGARDAAGLGHGELFAAEVAAECLGAGMGRGACVRKLAAEGGDLNDLHRAGELAGWFSDVLEGV
jgi:hypothetical protein